MRDLIRPATRRGFLLGATAAAASALTTPAHASEPGVSFLVIGDWGNPYVAAQRRVADAMGRIGAEEHNAFVISTGDNFYTEGVETTDDPQWQHTFESVYTAPALQTPWYVVLGNHDYHGSPGAQVRYTRLSNRWRMPARYWREDIALPGGETAAFFFIDTTPIAGLIGIRDAIPQADFGARDQVMWLERELAACSARWKIVVGHHPILSSGVHGASLGVALHVQPLLERYGAQAYINGHDHDLEHLEANGVAYLCSGAGSEARPMHSMAESRFASAQPGFAACNLSSAALDVQFYDQTGAELYRTSIPAR